MSKRINFKRRGVVLAAQTRRDGVITSVRVAIGDTDHTIKIEGVGFARRVAGDEPNDQIGFELALGRALVHAGNRLIKHGNGLVRTQDELARHAADIAKRPPWQEKLAAIHKTNPDAAALTVQVTGTAPTRPSQNGRATTSSLDAITRERAAIESRSSVPV